MGGLHDTLLWMAVVMLLLGVAIVWKQQFARGKTLASTLPSSKFPGPKGLPVFGILHLLARAHEQEGRHRALAKLAGTYGDIMYVKLGSFPALVASSMDTARLFLKTHDATFASRPSLAVTEHVFYGGNDVAFAPHGKHWRQTRKICLRHLLNPQKNESFNKPCEAESRAIAVELWRGSRGGTKPVDLSAGFRAMSFNIFSRTLAGDTFLEFADALIRLLPDISVLISRPLVGDFVPCLRWLDFPTIWRMKKVFTKFDAFAQSLLDRQRKQCLNSDDTTILGTLLQLATEDPFVTPTIIKSLILDMFVAGTDSIASTLEWSTTLLLKHPSCAQKLQHELDQVVGPDRQVQGSDISHMKYLHCVVKESMRLCPVGPLGLLHFSTEEVTVRGFTLPKGTVLIMNYWAINRDPAVWKSPEEFRPERFMDDAVVDLSGLSDFKVLPFGAGRRMCPGIGMALPTVMLALAKLFHTFEWVSHGDIDMEERPGITMSRKNPLMAIPKPRLNLDLL